MSYLADMLYPYVDIIVVVLDNLNTHNAASFYAAFPPEEAQRLANRFEFHHTPRRGSWLITRPNVAVGSSPPKRGSWLNMAEIELSVLSRPCLGRPCLGRPCLGRRISDKPTLTQEGLHWQTRRNVNLVKVDWHFTTTGARIKLKHLYPELHIHDCPPETK